MTTRGGAREGAGRPKKLTTDLPSLPDHHGACECAACNDAYGKRRPQKLTPADASAALLTAAVYELSIGQSSVELAQGAKGEVRPTVKAYAKTARAASRAAQAVFDELVKKYNPTEPEPKK